MTLLVRDLTAKFLEYIADKRSENTHKFYAGRLVALDKLLGAKQVRRLKRKHMLNYLDYANTWQTGDLAGQPKAPDTIRGNGAALQQMQKIGIKKGWIKEPLIDEEDIPMPAGRKRTRLPTAAEIEQVRSVSSAAFKLIYDALRRSGARPNEMARATVADWDQVTGVILLREHKTAAKTGEPREIAVGERLAELIEQSLAGRTEGPLFVTPTSLQWTTQSLSAAFRKARNQLDLDRRLVLYNTRHGHATAMYEAFGELATQLSIGHSTGMLGRYAKIPMEKRRAMQDSLAA